MIQIPDAVARRLVTLLRESDFSAYERAGHDSSTLRLDARDIAGVLEIQLREAKRKEER